MSVQPSNPGLAQRISRLNSAPHFIVGVKTTENGNASARDAREGRDLRSIINVCTLDGHVLGVSHRGSPHVIIPPAVYDEQAKQQFPGGCKIAKPNLRHPYGLRLQGGGCRIVTSCQPGKDQSTNASPPAWHTSVSATGELTMSLRTLALIVPGCCGADFRAT